MTLPTWSKTGLGFDTPNGLLITGQQAQTTRLEMLGTYASNQTGTFLGTRAACHRLYGAGDDLVKGTIVNSSSNPRYSFDSGHVVILSCGAPQSYGNYKSQTTSGGWWHDVINGNTISLNGVKIDTLFQNMFTAIETWNWGDGSNGTGKVVPFKASGNSINVPGSDYRGNTANELWFAFGHEPNIAPNAQGNGTQFGTPAEFAGAMKHLMVLYDAMGFGTKHIYFVPILSYPSSTNVCDNFYDRPNSNDITASGARPVDACGWDIYFPSVEKNNGTATPDNETNFTAKFNQGYLGTNTTSGFTLPQATINVTASSTTNFSSASSGSSGVLLIMSSTGTQSIAYTGKTSGSFTGCTGGTGTVASGAEVVASTGSSDSFLIWTRRYLGANVPHIIGEYAIRLETKNGPTSGIAPRNSTWLPSWYSALDTFESTHKLQNGSYPVRFMCQFAGAGNMAADSSGRTGIDNSIIGDQVTNGTNTNFQQPGFSLRPALNAFHDQSITWGNPLLTGSNGVTPTGVSAPTPALGVFNTLLSWGTNAANASYNVYKDGVITQSGLTGSSATVFSTGNQPYPQTHTYQVSGVGTNGTESALSSVVSITYTASGSPPGVPSGLAVTSVGQITAVATCTAGTGSPTGYNWYLNGAVSPSFSFTTANPSVTLTGLTSGTSYTLGVSDFNASAESAQTSTVSFTTSAGPDTAKPTVPTSLAVSGTPAYNAVVLTWGGSTDPTVAGQTRSGLAGYRIYRSLSQLPNSGTLIGTSTSTSFTDNAPANSLTQSVVNYYSVSAIDVAGNESDQITPLLVGVPQVPTPNTPVAILVPSVAIAQSGQLISFDASGSLAGTAGAIASYQFNFGDGSFTTAQTSPFTSHAFVDAAPTQYNVTLTVTDTASNQSQATVGVTIEPPGGGNFQFTNVPMMVKNKPVLASDVNSMGAAFDTTVASLTGNVVANNLSLFEVGGPVTPRRHGNAVWCSVNPEMASSTMTMNATTAYVLRAYSVGGLPFSNLLFEQTAASVTGVTGALVAIYDVSGVLMSPATATDLSATFMTTGLVNVSLDAAPFDPPLGTDANSLETDEFFIYIWLGAVGATHPVLRAGSSLATVNIGCNAATTASQAAIQTVPLFSTAGNTPATALVPPTTLGTLTPMAASPLALLI